MILVAEISDHHHHGPSLEQQSATTGAPTAIASPSYTYRQCFILDVICTSDEYLMHEEEIGIDMIHALRHQWNNDGICIAANNRIIISDEESFEMKYSPTACKLNRYQAYKEYVMNELRYTSCQVVPLTFGVRGFIPKATFKSVEAISRVLENIPSVISHDLAPEDEEVSGPNPLNLPKKRMRAATASLMRKLMLSINHKVNRAIISIHGAWKQHI